MANLTCLKKNPKSLIFRYAKFIIPQIFGSLYMSERSQFNVNRKSNRTGVVILSKEWFEF